MTLLSICFGKSLPFKNLKANSETKVLAKTPCKTLKTNGEKQKRPVSHCGTFFENTSTANIKLYKKNTPKDRGF